MSRPNFQRISVAILFLLASLPVFSDSQVRIVRLSYIDGTVQIARDSEQGYEKALLNLPISQGAKLRTMDGGRAEVEFEDATVAVFKGDIQIEGALGTVNVAKNQTADFDLSDNDRYTLAKSIQPEPYDDW